MKQSRRLFLKSTMVTGSVAVAVLSGLLRPQVVLAAWPKAAFEATKVDAALSGLVGSSNASKSGKIKIKAPDIAENGAVVPVTISTTLASPESINIIADQNMNPLVASFVLGKSTQGFVSTRIKMGKTSKVVAVVKSGGKLYRAEKDVKVTIGGCGG